MYFKIELNPRLGKWVIYVCNSWFYLALRETLPGTSGNLGFKSGKVKLFETWTEADQFATTTGLRQAYQQRNFKHENQTSAA